MRKINIMNDDEIIKFRQSENKSNNNSVPKEKENSFYLIIIKSIILILFVIYISGFYSYIINYFNYFIIKDDIKDNINDNNNINNNIIDNINDNYNEENDILNKKIENCEEIDPINLLEKRIKNAPFNLCIGKNTKHICYSNFII